jgi:hypothetical protein
MDDRLDILPLGFAATYCLSTPVDCVSFADSAGSGIERGDANVGGRGDVHEGAVGEQGCAGGDADRVVVDPCELQADAGAGEAAEEVAARDKALALHVTPP